MEPSIALITFTRNSSRELRRLLTQVAPLVDEIVVVDGFSTDDTVEIAKLFGAKVYQRRPWGYAEPDRMFALKKVESNWVLYLDTDEILCPELARNLRKIVENAHENMEIGAFLIKRVDFEDFQAYWISNQIRLYRKGRVVYKGLVHELPEVHGKLVELPLEYCIAHFPKVDLKKLLFYARLEALEYYEHPTRSYIRKALRALTPLSAIPLVAYNIVLAKKGLLFNRKTVKYSALLGIYEAFVHTTMKFRAKCQREMAKIVQSIGLIQLLKLDR